MIILLLLTGLACQVGGGAPGETELGEGQCIDNGDCFEGEGCVDGSCAAADCIESSACALDSYCDAEAKTCLAGCQEDADCGAGTRCEAGTCVERGCRSSELDCQVGEVCNLSNGSCWTPRASCRSCALDPLSCGGGSHCLLFEGQEESEASCYDECSTQSDCPAGFSCSAINFGAFEVKLCYADCSWLRGEGWL